jgi:hypothetical protein
MCRSSKPPQPHSQQGHNQCWDERRPYQGDVYTAGVLYVSTKLKQCMHGDFYCMYPERVCDRCWQVAKARP